MDTSINRAQPPATTSVQPIEPVGVQKSVTQQISVGKESEPVMVVAESGEFDDEDEIQVASQETKTQVVQQSAGESQEQEVIIESTGSVPEREKFVENSVDQEKPVIPEVVKQVGVTHSGPGVIPDTITVDVNDRGVQSLPVSYAQAEIVEKQTQFKESKHWLMGTVMYVWRKLNPNYGRKEDRKKKYDMKDKI